jgi:hypothetical protein
MTQLDLPEMPVFFDRYIKLVPQGDLIDALTQTRSFDSLIDAPTLEQLGDLRYAPGKWTVADILQHLIDTERIMAYRALRIARNDKTSLPGFDEESFAEFTDAANRTVADMLDEFSQQRDSTIQLFSHFTDEMLLRSGTASNSTISTLALGFMLVGHAQHHANVLRERYLPLLA